MKLFKKFMSAYREYLVAQDKTFKKHWKLIIVIVLVIYLLVIVGGFWK